MSRTPSQRPFWLAAAIAVVLINFGDRTSAAQVSPNVPAVTGFVERVTQYAELHRKLEATLPKLPQEATPQQIDKNERTLGLLIQSARKEARRGDLFTPEMTAFVKNLMAQVFGGPDGRQLRSSVMDENVKELPLRVNQRFPDVIPISTMPPAILKALPELPEQMQYRFVASQFVLLDTHSHLVADFIPAVLPPVK